MKFNFKQIYIDEAARDDIITSRVRSHYPQIPSDIIQGQNRLLELTKSISLSEGKQILWLTHNKGKFLKPCPGTADSYLCCNYQIINESTNCPIDCTYCILQTYINNPVITIYTNIEKLFNEIASLSQLNPERILRIGTGELTDSLALDPITGLSAKLIERLPQFPNILLELKSKTDHISHLLDKSPRRVILSWSVNPHSRIRTDEQKSSSLKHRLLAMQNAIEKGFLIGLHFDPIIYESGARKSYLQLIKQIAKHVDPGHIAWISLGTFRYPPQLKPVIQDRFPQNELFTAEQISGLDGKIRYIKPLRLAMYQEIVEVLRQELGDVFIYFCMESQDVWKKILGFGPQNSMDVDWAFANNLYRKFPRLELPTPKRHSYQQPIRYEETI
jgi:spore photoproduct lyase